MATTRPLTALLRTRPITASAIPVFSPAARSAALFSTSTSRLALGGAPPTGYRLPKPKRWNEDTEGTFDKIGNYFLLTEMMRGMYVVLEQFFRPPYTIFYPFEKGPISPRFRGEHALRRCVQLRATRTNTALPGHAELHRAKKHC